MVKQGHGHTGKEGTSIEDLRWQVRIYLSDDFAEAARDNPEDPKLAPILDIVKEFDGRLKHQHMAFADYVPHFQDEEKPAHLKNIESALAVVEAADSKGDIDATLEALEEYGNSVMQFIHRYSSLYLWTRGTLQRDGIEGQYAKRFAVYADGNQEVYSRETADQLEEKLKELVDQGIIKSVSKIDSNPQNNPQAPEKYQVLSKLTL